MFIDVSDILQLNGLSKKVDVSIPAEECGIESLDCVFENPPAIFVELTNINGLIRAKGTVQAEYTTYCARCLKPLSMVVSKRFDEEFAGLDSLEESQDVYQFSDKAVNIGEVVRDVILLEIPIRHLCSEGCKSLCPGCGKDLNKEDCTCEQTTYNAQFEVLKDFFQ